MKRSAVALSTLALLAVACSRERPESAGPTAIFPPEPTTQRPAGHIGDTLELTRIGDQKIAVTLEQVVNPATVPNGWGDPGKTYIATRLTITNNAAATVVGNSNSDVSVVGSDNKDYRADLATVVECEDFLYGWFIIAVGSAKSGCVTFALPSGVSPTKVRYTPSSGISRDVGEWLTP